MQLKIKQEFRKLIPPLSDDEYKGLSESLNKEGCRDSIKIWNGYIADGHNRYEICLANNIEFKTDEIPADSEDEAKVWIINNQLDRRNLSLVQRGRLEFARKDIEIEIGKKRKSEAGKKHGKECSKEVLSESDKTSFPPEIIGESGENDAPNSPPHNTRKEIANRLGIGPTKAGQLETLIKNNADDLLDEIEQGTKSVDGAYKEFKKTITPLPPKQSKQKTAAKPMFNKVNDNIEWAAYSWNPVTGCLHGCPYCYARGIALHYRDNYPKGFDPDFREDRLTAPFNTKPNGNNNRVFLCSMADLFGDWVPDEWIEKVFKVCEESPQWTYLCLTKNPKRYLTLKFPKNVWIGMTTDTQKRYDEAVRIVKQLDNKIVFVSFEPFKERIEIGKEFPFDWAIIGGQSRTTGEPEFQPDKQWVKLLLRDILNCDLKLPIFFKTNLSQFKEIPGGNREL